MVSLWEKGISSLTAMVPWEHLSAKCHELARANVEPPKGKPEKKINKKSDMKIPIQGHIWSRVVTGWSRVGPLISSIGRFSQVTVGHGLVTP